MPEYGSSMPGTLLMQGLTNAGNSVQEGIQAYQANKQKDALLTGQIEPYLQQLQSQADNLSPASASALNKMMTGSATLKDKMLLYGDVASTRDQIQARQQQQLAQQQIVAGGLQNQRTSAIINGMQAYANGPGGQAPAQPQGQPMQQGTPQPTPQGSPTPQQGQGAPGPQRSSTTVNPPTPISIDDPSIRALYSQALAATGYDPEKATSILQSKADAVNLQNRQNYDQLTKTVKDTGRLVYAGPNYTNGVHDFDKYYNEQIMGAGTASQSYTQGDKLIQYAANSRPPVPVVTAAGQQAPVGQDGTSDAMDKINSVTPYNVNDPKWIADNTAAQQDMAASAQRVANSRLLVAAASAYASGNTSQINALRTNPAFAPIQQFLTGKNPAASLQTALSLNTGAVINSLKSAQGGTSGSRVTAAEFEDADQLLAKPNMDLPTIFAAAQNVNALNERAYAIDSAKAHYRKIMPEDAATEKAVTQFGAPPEMQTAGGAKTSKSVAMTKVVSPTGQVGSVPVTRLSEYMASGYKQLQ